VLHLIIGLAGIGAGAATMQRSAPAQERAA
jgi:hypothetical protein